MLLSIVPTRSRQHPPADTKWQLERGREIDELMPAMDKLMKNFRAAVDKWPTPTKQ
jgi:hypothetical protein